MVFGLQIVLSPRKMIMVHLRSILYIISFCFCLYSCSVPRGVGNKGKASKESGSLSKQKATDRKENSHTNSTKDKSDKTSINNNLDSAKSNTNNYNKFNSNNQKPAELINFGENQSVLKDRNKDTLTLMLGDIRVMKPLKEEERDYTGLTNEFIEAINDFDNEKFDLALVKFKFFSETLSPNDSLFYESKFYISECYISNNEFDNAEEILQYLLDNKNEFNKTNEKSLLRIGQISCALNETKKAQDFFKELKKKYPKSIYLKLANCESVTTK